MLQMHMLTTETKQGLLHATQGNSKYINDYTSNA